MKKIYNIWPYLLAVAAVFYLLPMAAPYLLKNEMLQMGVMVLLTVGISAWCGVKHGFAWVFPLCVGLIFWPSIYLFYNRTAWIFVIFFAVAALLVNGLGSLFRHK